MGLIDIPAYSRTTADARFAKKDFEMAGVELAYVENGTGTSVTVTAATPLAGMVLVVPPTDFPVEIVMGAEFGVLVSGGGLFYIDMFQDGVGAAISTWAGPGVVAANQQLYSGFQQPIHGHKRLGASAVARTFRLKGSLLRDSGSALTGYVANYALNPTFLKAVGT
jgi:hypothetical protein